MAFSCPARLIKQGVCGTRPYKPHKSRLVRNSNSPRRQLLAWLRCSAWRRGWKPTKHQPPSFPRRRESILTTNQKPLDSVSSTEWQHSHGFDFKSPDSKPKCAEKMRWRRGLFELRYKPCIEWLVRASSTAAHFIEQLRAAVGLDVGRAFLWFLSFARTKERCSPRGERLLFRFF